jgi:mono/diheme cytochrome c family protein
MFDPWRVTILGLTLWALATSPGLADAQLDRGAYLVRGLAACGNCHTPKDADGKAIATQELAGGFIIEAPVFRAVAPNITPDRETGIGTWTDEQIVDSIRNGKRPDGSLIGPPMPVEFYRQMSDTDVRAMVAYLRSVRPVANKVEKSTYKIPLPASYGPAVSSVPDVPRANTAAYGKYLSDIAHCMECHTPMERGALVPGKLGAGGRMLPALPTGVIVSSNLTPANPDGIARWTDVQVKTAITDGIRPDGRQLVRLMAFDWYKHVDPIDLDALVTYLRTLAPATP